MSDRSETKPTADEGRLDRRVRRAARTLLAALMRLLLLAPLRLVRGLLWCMAAACDKLAEAVNDAERAIGPVCDLPFHADALRQLNEAKAEDRRKLLEVLERGTR